MIDIHMGKTVRAPVVVLFLINEVTSLKNFFGLLLLLISGTTVAEEKILAQYSVTGMNFGQQITYINQGIKHFNPTQITLAYPGAMTFLANEVASNIATQTKTPITLNLLNAYWPSANFPTGQVIVNLMGNTPTPQPSPIHKNGNFFDYTNSTHGSFFD